MLPAKHRVDGWWPKAAKLNLARLRRGWTIDELAQLAGLNPNTAGDILAGRRRGQLHSVVRLCNALDIPTELVISMEDAEPCGERLASAS